MIEIEFDPDATFVRHLRCGGRQTSSAHVLDGNDDIAFHELETGLNQELFREWIADLNRWALLV